MERNLNKLKKKYGTPKLLKFLRDLNPHLSQRQKKLNKEYISYTRFGSSTPPRRPTRSTIWQSPVSVEKIEQIEQQRIEDSGASSRAAALALTESQATSPQPPTVPVRHAAKVRPPVVVASGPEVNSLYENYKVFMRKLARRALQVRASDLVGGAETDSVFVKNKGLLYILFKTENLQEELFKKFMKEPGMKWWHALLEYDARVRGDTDARDRGDTGARFGSFSTADRSPALRDWVEPFTVREDLRHHPSFHLFNQSPRTDPLTLKEERLTALRESVIDGTLVESRFRVVNDELQKVYKFDVTGRGGDTEDRLRSRAWEHAHKQNHQGAPPLPPLPLGGNARTRYQCRCALCGSKMFFTNSRTKSGICTHSTEIEHQIPKSGALQLYIMLWATLPGEPKDYLPGGSRNRMPGFERKNYKNRHNKLLIMEAWFFRNIGGAAVDFEDSFVPCCTLCNQIKRDMLPYEYKATARRDFPASVFREVVVKEHCLDDFVERLRYIFIETYSGEHIGGRRGPLGDSENRFAVGFKNDCGTVDASLNCSKVWMHQILRTYLDVHWPEDSIFTGSLKDTKTLNQLYNHVLNSTDLDLDGSDHVSDANKIWRDYVAPCFRGERNTRRVFPYFGRPLTMSRGGVTATAISFRNEREAREQSGRGAGDYPTLRHKYEEMFKLRKALALETLELWNRRY